MTSMEATFYKPEQQLKSLVTSDGLTKVNNWQQQLVANSQSHSKIYMRRHLIKAPSVLMDHHQQPCLLCSLPVDHQLSSSELGAPTISSTGSNKTSLFGSPIAIGSPQLANDETSLTSEVELVYLPHEDPSLFDQPTAILEKPHICLAYLAAVASNLIDHVKQHSVEQTLNITLLGYKTLNCIPDHPKPVTTLNKVYQRLGLDAQAFIINNQCSKCYCVYTLDAIKNTCLPNCQEAGCTGVFWEYSNPTRSERHPKQVAAYTDIVGSLRRMFMRPDFVVSLRAGAQAHENHGDGSVLHDVCNGTAWGPHQFGLLQRVCRDGIVEDIPAPIPSHLALDSLLA
ncbi:U3 small nucleolar RNA-associated protein 6 [Rhizoctonia solani]|uniref:U3 small nucleolar RNA-associated protein 6 n=1 Tax=Rhizoctonia solani TaxID=456999 RepID=A0A8H8T1P6_9AGAM|nr:U3 small nucleolar RNA-associated protein 6 [Rhizoctonia solani]QRW26681.1 U3 small nucleolar RNA-associated protein 6 [Rhizoctonia solani]